MRAAIYLVDAFCDGPGSGNPAGVCPLEVEPGADWMQLVAREMNQAETAFTWPESEARRSPPRTCCGAKACSLTCSRLADGRIEMDFPERVPHEQPAPEGLSAVLGRAPRWVGANGMDGFVELTDDAELRALRPISPPSRASACAA